MREIGYLFGQYKRITNRYESGVLTGKNPHWGGSLVRREATGYGSVYFMDEMLKVRGESLEGKVCVVSGSGNVAIYTIEKIQTLGGKVVACSDSDGVIYHKRGIDLNLLKQLKNVEPRRIADYAKEHGDAEYICPEGISGTSRARSRCRRRLKTSSTRPRRVSLWPMAASPSAKGRTCRPPRRSEGLPGSGDRLRPGQGGQRRWGCHLRGLEMQQNASRDAWTFEHTEQRLHEIMKEIHRSCYETAAEFGSPGNYVIGSNIVGFLRVAEAMLAFGLI